MKQSEDSPLDHPDQDRLTAAAPDLLALDVVRKTGDEAFRDGDRELSFDVRNFWQWACSNLASNTLRGILAEFLVAQALGAADGHRVEWDAFDVLAQDGDKTIRVEVKSAAYLQSWHQTSFSTISFDIRQTIAWYAETNTSGKSAERQADVYVFALLAHKEKSTFDPSDLSQWNFFIVPTAILDEKFPTQKSISLSTIQRLGTKSCNFQMLATTIREAHRTL